MVHTFLIKYAEIAVKGKNRYIFEDTLVANLTRRLSSVDGHFCVRKESGRIFAEADGDYDYDGAVLVMQKTFGVVGVAPVLLVDQKSPKELADDVIGHIRDTYAKRDFSFKVLARRTKKDYPLNSMELDAFLGDKILEAFPEMRVDVHHPDVFLYVEIRPQISIYSQVLPGVGGLPTGTSGKAMLLLSAGIDSPVAGYCMAKRGVTVEAVYFHAPPYTSERAKQKVIDLAHIMAAYCGSIKLYIVNFTDIQLYIYDKCPHDQLTILMRRYMMRIAEHFAKEEGCLGLSTGESIGQVASQTMYSLAATDAVCTLPVYRPLITYDKREIISLAEQIGTYSTSILPFEDCCTIFVAKHPVTKPSIAAMEKSEEHLSEKIDELLRQAIEQTEVVTVEA